MPRATKRKRPTQTESPQDRLLRQGASALTDKELLALLLCTDCAGAPVLEISRDLLEAIGGLSGLLVADEGLLRRPGIERAQAATLLAAREIACRLSHLRLADRPLLDNPAIVANYLLLRYQNAGQELLGALFLDTECPSLESPQRPGAASR